MKMENVRIICNIRVQAFHLIYIACLSRPFDAGGVGIERRENAGVGKTALKVFDLCYSELGKHY